MHKVGLWLLIIALCSGNAYGQFWKRFGRNKDEKRVEEIIESDTLNQYIQSLEERIELLTIARDSLEFVVDSLSDEEPVLVADSILEIEVLPEETLAELVVPDSLIDVNPEFPESVYMERLAAISDNIPMHYNTTVRRFIDLYLVKRRPLVRKVLNKSQYYHPLFEEKLRAAGMPLELANLSIIESALAPEAVSRVGATGLWQFMYYTAKMYDLSMNDFVDERRDPYAATDAAVRYLQDAYKLFGDWHLAVASYNCGMGNVRKAIRRAGGAKDIWKIYPYLPRETRGYVPSFIAANYFMNYAYDHNLSASDTLLLPSMNTDTVMARGDLDLIAVAKRVGLTVEEFAALNPSYRITYQKYSAKPIRLIVPQEYADSLRTEISGMYISEVPKEIINLDLIHYKSGRGSMPTFIYHKVRRGESLSVIAQRYKTSVSKIKRWNGLRSNTIRIGQRLKIQTYSQYATYASNSSPAPGSGKYFNYRVKRGDTLWDLSRKYPNNTVASIKQQNKVSSRLKVGTVLKLKR